jgi:ribulose-phosphate 3-epimerase
MNDIRKLALDSILVAPSILAADFARLGEDIKRVSEAGCDLLHLDVMDGHFVPNLTIGPPLISSIRKISNLVFDTHLMISDPLKYAAIFVNAGADHITFHLESDNDPAAVIDAIRATGATVGISLKPKTPAEKLFPWLDQIDLVLIMTVEPGFGGQSFMADMMPKVKAVHERICRIGRPVHLEVDGGIDGKNVVEAAGAGANMMVAGTSVFRNPAGAASAIKELHAAAQYLPARSCRL